jgi:hypothetical protein
VIYFTHHAEAAAAALRAAPATAEVIRVTGNIAPA